MYNETVHHLFRDFRKAYDLVRREVLYNTVMEFGIPTKLVRMINICMIVFPSKLSKTRRLLIATAFRLSFLEYVIRKGQLNQVGLKLNGTYQLLAYADVVILVGDNIDTKIKTEILNDSGKKLSLEIRTEKTKYMLLSCHQNAGQNREVKIATRSFENVSQFKYLEMTVTNKTFIQEEIKRRLNSGYACYHSVPNTLSSHVLSRKKKLEYTKL
jgi:hypothetical protein